ncbi:MAG: hypothetical protein F6J96_10460 [Symploca sp. SIO1C2]|nr:hypothetical protein [Symploca sp. SIO1C2]
MTNNNGPAKYLTAHFQGYFMFRMATDPDPTNEKRGLSGYTMALVNEDDFDQKIRLQFTEEFLNKNLREPAEEMGLRENLEDGVQVYSVTFDGKPWESIEENHGQKHPLMDAKVSLGPFPDDTLYNESELPTFESRNNITGSDDTMAFVIDPFHLYLKKEEEDIIITAKDDLNPAEPDQKIWQILEPEIYGRRLTTSLEQNSQEVARAINVFDYYGYFYDRRRFLKSKIQELEKLESISEENKIEIEQYKSRLYQLEFWGDRVINKLGFKTSWNFEINGKKCLSSSCSVLGGKIDTNQLWPVQLWFGGWDGDLLVGYMRGSLSMPFTPN